MTTQRDSQGQFKDSQRSAAKSNDKSKSSDRSSSKQPSQDSRDSSLRY